MVHIAQGYLTVQERIARAAERAGRRPGEITLVAVTKTWPAEVVIAAHEAGLRHFGENRVEELSQKRLAVTGVLGTESDIVWHQIGTLQSRKTHLAADNADVFHALDRLKIARRLSQRLQSERRVLPLFLEVNLSGEASKSGFHCSDWENDATQRSDLRNVVETIAGMPGLQLQGLMTMAPWGVAGDHIRSLFRRTRQLAEWLQSAVPQVKLTELSMGMTDDFEIAIEEGATHVRIGRAIFGSRH
jgi:pyridoxal phosphate enzyme (YggS family)